MKIGDRVKITNKDFVAYGSTGVITHIGAYIRIKEDSGTYSTWFESSLEVIDEYYVKASHHDLLRLYKRGSYGWSAEKYKDGTVVLGVSVGYTVKEDFVKALQMLFDAKFPEIVYHTTIETKEPVHTLWVTKDLLNNMGYEVVEKNKKITK